MFFVALYLVFIGTSAGGVNLNKLKINLKIKGNQLQLRDNCYPYHRNNKVI